MLLPPPTESRRLMEITETFCHYPPPTESRRLLETTEKTQEIEQAQLGSSDYGQLVLLLSCPSHNCVPLAGECHCPLCHCGQVVSRLVDDMIGGGPSSVAPRSRNPPLVNIGEQYSSDNTCAHGEGISSEDRCQQTHSCQNCVTGAYCIERQLRCYHDWNSGECP